MDAFERRLRSIYEAFDARNPKAAVKLATAALQKHKDSQILRVLKGLALQRIDRAKEAFEVCDQVLSEAPTDEQVLNILSMVYKSKVHQAKLTSAYEVAVKARPNDAGLLAVLLSMYTRALDFVKLQQSAMKLHRLDRSRGDFLWWIVTSLVLQARASGQRDSNGEKLLQLAQSMAAKQLDEGRSEEGDPVNALLLYHSILQERNQNREALEAVKGPLGDAYNLEGERDLMVASLTAKLGDCKAAASIFRHVALHNPQNWEAIQGFLDCVLPATCPSSSVTPTNGVPQISSLSIKANGSVGQEHLNGAAHGSDAAPQEAEEFVKDLLAAVSDGSAAKMRGPLLAAVDLEARILSRAERVSSGQSAGPSGQPGRSTDTPDLAAAVLHYFKCVGHLASCAADLRPYSARVDGASRQRLNADMHAHCKTQEPADGRPPSSVHIQRQVAAFQVQHDLGLPEYRSPEEAETHAAELVAVYRQATVLERRLDEKERGIADGLIALAAGALTAAWKLEATPRRQHRLLRAVLVLEAAQVARRVSAPLRLAAMGLYGLLGAPTLAVESFTALDIKHIQHDTLSGHWLLPSLLGTLRSDMAAQLLTDCLRMFEDHNRDAGDTVLAAFQASSFTKVLEFVRFKERLQQSHSRAVAYCESAVLALTSPPAIPESAVAQVQDIAAGAMDRLQSFLPEFSRADGQATSALRFNEDLSTRPAWLPPDSGRPSLALARWWSSQPDQQTSHGYGRCWWACTLAAESAAPEAKAHRAAVTASLQWRCLLPSLIASATSADHAAAAASLPSIVERLVSFQGLQDLGELPERVAALQKQLPSSLPDLCEMLHLATFAAASAVQASLSRPTENEAAQEAGQQLGLVDSIAAALSAQLSKELRQSGGPVVAMGPAVFVAAAFANEEVYWLAMCLQAWAQPQKRRKKGKKGGVEATDSSSSAHDALQEKLRCSCQSLVTGLQELREAVTARSIAEDEMAPTLDGLLEELTALEGQLGTGGLWAWEHRLDARRVLERLLHEQNVLTASVVNRLDHALAVLGKHGH
ncbi:hypothetical protein WJX75_002093 [Coccomyxa subellipsoidea]|uniref:N-terminal acetyltransferase B complex subunit NAA25 homolog n=1 Tax=Coccomyxa subellipsoidea TaxID=248742 RepID=A0ABR2YBY7_9CHLO